MHGWVMLETQRIIIKMVCWQMNVVVKSRSQRHTMCFVRFLAIISNLLVKLKTVWDNEFCLCPYIMGSADAAFVTAVPKLVVFWVCVGFSDNQTVTFKWPYWCWRLSISFRELVTYPRQEEFGRGGCTCACSGWKLQEQRERLDIDVTTVSCLLKNDVSSEHQRSVCFPGSL